MLGENTRRSKKRMCGVGMEKGGLSCGRVQEVERWMMHARDNGFDTGFVMTGTGARKGTTVQVGGRKEDEKKIRQG